MTRIKSVLNVGICTGLLSLVVGLPASADSVGWAVGQVGTIVHTSDGGTTWSPQPSGSSAHFYDVRFVDANNGWAVGNGGTIVHTSNGGSMWSSQTSGVGVNLDLGGVSFVDANNGWAVGQVGTIVHTSNGGSMWSSQTSGTGVSLAGVSFVDANNGWAVGNSGTIVHTSNGGSMWSSQSSGLGINLAGVSFVDANNGWAVGYGGTIVHTSDGGTTWSAQPSGTGRFLFRVSFLDASNGWAVGDAGTILHTSNGGSMWSSTRGTGGVLFGVSFVDANNGWAGGQNGAIVHTSDGGSMWSSQTSGTGWNLYGVSFVNPMVPVTIASAPASLAFTVSGAGCQPGSYTAPQTLAWTPGSSCIVSFASPQSGATGTQYVFGNWADDPSALNPRTLATPAAAATYTANFTTQYLLTTAANPSAGGTVSGGGWWNANATAAVAASANNGYGFSSWTGATLGPTPTTGTVLMNGPKSVTGNFVLLTPVTVTTSSAGPGFTVDGTSYFGALTFFWAPATTHTIATSSPQAFVPGTQYVFVNWSDGGALSHLVTTPSTAITYTANFTTQYLLTTVASPAGEGSISPATGYVDAGSTVSVSATANPTYVFYGFSGGLSGTTTPQKLTVSAPATVTANFLTGPDLTITKTHSGTFPKGGRGSYTITVSNLGQTPSKGTISMSDMLPAGLTGLPLGRPAGWNCIKLTCTSSNSLFRGSPAVFSLTVNVKGNAPASVTNIATVSGGGDVNLTNNTATDLTAIK